MGSSVISKQLLSFRYERAYIELCMEGRKEIMTITPMFMKELIIHVGVIDTSCS